jgi:transposase-like protein
MKNTYRYSEAFKLRVIRAIEDGEVENLNQARQKYGIRGAGTVESWIRKYGKNQIHIKGVTSQHSTNVVTLSTKAIWASGWEEWKGWTTRL